jgi:4-amino-4-deoxy-L-arabinose transferase-like glycosyltransferase
VLVGTDEDVDAIVPDDLELTREAHPPATVVVEPVSSRAWGWWLAAISALGLAIRVASVLGDRGLKPSGDAFYYFNGARLLVEGKGWLNPFIYFGYLGLPPHGSVQTASWPPLFVVVMAVPQAIGIHSFLAARLWLCLVGIGAIVLVAYAGREIAGRRVGLLAAALMALYPNIWISTNLALSEVLTPLLVSWVLWMAYRYWRKPSFRRVVWLGVAMGVTMLARDELSLLCLFLITPLVLSTAGWSWARRGKALALAALVVALLIAPWVGFNLSRFDKPTFISTGLGVTVASANCPETYSGPNAGYWSFFCTARIKVDSNADESVQSGQYEAAALHFIRQHLSELPKVELEREGRAFGFFRPAQQIQLDTTVDQHPYHWAFLGLGLYYVFFIGALGGSWVLRQRRIPIFPLWAVGANVAVAVLMTFGTTRYRTAFEVSLLLLTAVLVDQLLSSRHRGSHAL